MLTCNYQEKEEILKVLPGKALESTSTMENECSIKKQEKSPNKGKEPMAFKDGLYRVESFGPPNISENGNVSETVGRNLS